MLSQLQIDAGADGGFETGLFRFDLLRSQGKGKHGKAAGLIGGSGTNGPGLQALHGDGSGMHGGARCIDHLSGNRGSDLSEARAVTHKKRKSSGSETTKPSLHGKSLHGAAQSRVLLRIVWMTARPGSRHPE